MASLCTTWLQLKQALLTRLGDSTFYTDDTSVYSEAGAYLAEALRVWQCAAHFWKDRITFATAANTIWYDLSTIATNPAGLMAYTIKDQSILAEIQYHLIEPISLTSWIGTDMFTFSEVVAAMERRRNQFLLETGIHLNVQQTPPAPPPAEGRFDIPELANCQPIIDIRRLAWIDINSVFTQLWRNDEWSANTMILAWRLNPGTPSIYSVAVTPPRRVQLVPPPDSVGELEVVGAYEGAPLDPTVGVLLGVPDNFAWVVKYGALSDLLGKEGQARDPQRGAGYCERRWQEGIELARIYSSSCFAAVNSTPVPISSVYDFDAFHAGWQNTTATRPTDVLAAGPNLIAFNPKPDAAYGIDMDVLIPAPVPTADGDLVNLGPEEQDAILDYAQHIGSFKEAGAEFEATIPKYENFMRLAAQHNERLRALIPFSHTIHDRSLQEQKPRPQRRPSATGEPLRQ